MNRKKMVKKANLSILFVFGWLILFSQEGKDWNKTAYAKEIIAALTSPQMHGRGYVNGGDSLAAEYMRAAFQQVGLKPLGPDYYQKFTFPVNTFPGKVEFFILGKDHKTKKSIAYKGKPGIDMLIGAGSKSVEERYPVIVFDSTYTVSDERFEKFREKIEGPLCLIVVDDRNVTDKKKLDYFKKVKTNYFRTSGIVEYTNKLTHTVSQKESPFLIIKLLTDSLHIDFKKIKNPIIKVGIENMFIPTHVARNVIGYVPGSLYPDSFIVFSAHMDHLGQLGRDVFFPGANDNASGCAMLLNLARYYSQPQHKPACSIAFIAFAGEEVGLLGSEHYVKNPLFPLNSIRFLLNMDIMGTGEEGITVVNGTVFKNEFDKLVEINKENKLLKEVKIRGKAANSDHYAFSEKGVKAFFIYTMGGIKAYHDVYDKAETLPLTKFEELFNLIIHFTDYLQHH